MDTSLAVSACVFGILSGRKINIILGVLVFCVGLPGLNRASFLSVAMVVPFVLIAMRKKPLALFTFAASLISIVTLISIGYQQGYFKGTEIDRRINDSLKEFYDEGGTVAMDQRYYEVDVSISRFENDPAIALRLLFGYGTGAVIDMSESEDESVKGSQVTSERTVHNIHFLPVALLYRYGVVGIIWTTLIIFLIVFSLFKTAVLLPSSHFHPLICAKFIAGFYCLFVIAESLTASSFLLSSIEFGMVMAFAVRNK